MSAIVVDDRIVHYEVLGRGRPLIFLHGWVGSWRYWIPTMQALSTDFRTYALDFWGFGDTARNPSDYSLQSQVDLILKFIRRMGILRAAFVGHSLGGAVAVNLASRHAELVDRLMIVSTPLIAAALNPRLAASEPGSLADWLLSREPDAGQISAEASKSDGSAIEVSARTLLEMDLQDDLLNLGAPCLLVHGEKDPAVAPPQGGWLAGLSGKLHRITFQDSRHFPMLDHPVRFNRLLADFLSLKPGEDVGKLQLKEEWRRRMR